MVLAAAVTALTVASYAEFSIARIVVRFDRQGMAADDAFC